LSRDDVGSHPEITKKAREGKPAGCRGDDGFPAWAQKKSWSRHQKVLLVVILAPLETLLVVLKITGLLNSAWCQSKNIFT
jgi:hypothetical protein